MKVKYSDLKNKRIFITGGGSGIGASIVEHFCEQGSEVYFVDIDLKETKKLLNKIIFWFNSNIIIWCSNWGENIRWRLNILI